MGDSLLKNKVWLLETVCTGPFVSVCISLEYMCHCHVRSDNLSAVIISDLEYPSRVVFTLMIKIMDQFAMDFPKHSWKDESR